MQLRNKFTQPTNITNILTDNNHVYVSGYNGFWIYDIGDNGKIVYNQGYTGGEYDYIYGMDIDNDYLYIACSSGLFNVYDINNDFSLINPLTNFPELGASLQDLCVDDNFIYILSDEGYGDQRKRVYIIDKNKFFNDLLFYDECEGGTISASNFSPHDPSGAFDSIVSDDYETWSAPTSNEWIQYEFSEPKQIQTVRIYSLYHSGKDAIKDFEILASNDESSWVTLHTDTHPNDTSEFINYTFTNNTPYTYYRINVLNVHGSNGDITISEIEMSESYTSTPEKFEHILINPNNNWLISIYYDDNYLYSGDYLGNIYVYDKSDFSLYTTLSDASSDINQMFTDDNYLYVVTDNGNVFVYDKTNFTTPPINIQTNTNKKESVYSDGEFLYVGDNNINLYIYDINDSFNLVDTIDIFNNGIYGICKDDVFGYLYFGGYGSTLCVFNPYIIYSLLNSDSKTYTYKGENFNEGGYLETDIFTEGIPYFDISYLTNEISIYNKTLIHDTDESDGAIYRKTVDKNRFGEINKIMLKNNNLL